MQHLPMQALADERAHQIACLVARLAAAVVVRREIEQRAAADQQISAACPNWTTVGLIGIRDGGLDRLPAQRLAVEERRIAELGEQALLEAAQHGGERL